MTENMKKFLEALSADKEIAEKMKKASMDELLASAREMGIELTEADFEQPKELSDDDLAVIAGGSDEKKGHELSCVCPVAGGGGGTDRDNFETIGCACVLYGQGGDGSISDFNCFCAGAGIGFTDDVM